MITRKSIFSKFFLILSALAIFSYLFAIGLFEWINYEKEYKELQYKLDGLLATQSIILAEPLHNNNYDQVKMVMASVISDPDIDAIQIYDREDRLIDFYGTMPKGKSNLVKNFIIDYVEEDDIIKAGLLRISLTNKNIAKITIGHIKYDIFLFFALLFLLGLCSYVAYKYTVDPGLSLLLNSIKKYNATGQHEEISWSNDDEIGTLINTFNDMQLSQVYDKKIIKISEEKFSKAFSSSPDSISIIAKNNGHILEVNASQITFSGYSREELIGKSLFELGMWQEPKDRFRMLKELHKNGGVINHWPTNLITRSGKIKNCEISAELATINDEPCIVVVTRDFTERNKTEAALINSEKQFRNIFEYAPVGVCLVNKKGNIFKANTVTCEIIGYSMEELLGKSLTDFSHPDELSISVEHHKALFLGEIGKFDLERRYLHKGGHYIWASLNVSIVKDHNDEPSYIIAQIKDVSETRELTEKLSYQASHDSLTSLINRREFENRLKNILESSNLKNSEHALCYLDLDQFKIVNDTCGHTAGDELLRQLSVILKNKIRSRDTIARLGGDEFGILMEHCSIDNALNAAEAIRESVHQFQFSWEGNIFNIGASIGLVTIKESNDVTELLKAADTACYAAKDMGRNRVHIYKEDDAELLKRQGEMKWVSRINKALNEDKLFLVAQSIQSTINTKQGENKVEILLRMKDESDEIILPGTFLSAAERYGLASTLDRWVVKTTLNLILKNVELLSSLSMCSINLSGQSIGDKDFLEFIELIFNDFPEVANKICFEITETAAINNFSNAIYFINTLKKRGCRFALDDFGSGLSSFAYLKDLPIDFIKIDGMFIRDIANNETNYAMVKSINDIGHVMGKETIAEFVEDEKILAILKNIGIDYVQGYAIGKPKPFEI